MRSREDVLFSRGDLRDTLKAQSQMVANEVGSAPEEHFLKVDEDEWVASLVSRWSIEVPVLHLDQMWMDPLRETPVDVSWDHVTRWIEDPSTPSYVDGYRTTVHIPFTGEEDIFQLRPGSWSTMLPYAQVRPGEVFDVVEYPADSPVDIRSHAERLAQELETYLAFARRDVEPYNARVESTARAAIVARRERLKRNYAHLEQTGLPIGPPDGQVNKAYISEAIVRRPTPVLPATTSVPIALEPVLQDDVFSHILGVIRSVGHDMERAPGTYVHMGEEDRRQIFLLALNTHYRGQTTAEAFNVRGKTDLLVKHDGRNLFIGECKIWTGSKGFGETIDQLFRYAAWRDSKLAIVMFVNEKGLTKIVVKGRTTLSEHRQFVRWASSDEDTELRCTVTWPGDAEKTADLHVFFVQTPPA